jgi:hypothetical protein
MSPRNGRPLPPSLAGTAMPILPQQLWPLLKALHIHYLLVWTGLS